MTATDITQQTPAEIDGQLSELSQRRAIAQVRIDRTTEAIEKYEAGDLRYSSMAFTGRAQLPALRTERDDLTGQIEPLEAEYARRGGWSRFFWVTNGNGHVHSSTHCASCFPTTQFSWVTDLSGATEGEAVERYGEKMCTVCFPSAPTHPAWMKSVEEREAAEAAKKAAECPGSRTTEHDSSGIRYYQARAVCNHCHQIVSVNRNTLRMRAHKPGKES